MQWYDLQMQVQFETDIYSSRLECCLCVRMVYEDLGPELILH